MRPSPLTLLLLLLLLLLKVLKVAKGLCHFARFRSTMISGGGRMRPQQEALNSMVDIVVGTPGRLAEHFKEGNLSYADVRYVVSTWGQESTTKEYPAVCLTRRPLSGRSWTRLTQCSIRGSVLTYESF